jgi:hypothetical protein
VARELPAILLGTDLDETRGLEVLVGPDTPVDLCLKLATAVERLRAEQEGRSPEALRYDDRRQRLSGGAA